jgi:hypothetical protein
MEVEAEAARYKVEETASGIRVTVPARRNSGMIPLLGVLLGLYTFAGFAVIRQFLNLRSDQSKLLLGIWLLGWASGWVGVVLTLGWQLLGREILEVEKGSLIHRVGLFGIGRSRVYACDQITRFRSVDYDPRTPSKWAADSPPLSKTGVGPIAFDYDAKTYHLAPAVADAEARSLVEQLAKYLPKGACEN